MEKKFLSCGLLGGQDLKVEKPLIFSFSEKWLAVVFSGSVSVEVVNVTWPVTTGYKKANVINERFNKNLFFFVHSWVNDPTLPPNNWK